VRTSFGGSRRDAHRRGNTVMIQPHHRAEHLVSFLADVPPMAMGHLHDLLGSFEVVYGCEGVVLEVEPQPSSEHLLGQPGVAIDVDLDGEREPFL
jgi:hypothetical protein